MRILSPAFVREKNQLASSHVITRAFALTIPGAPAVFRVVNYDQDVVFHGFTYFWRPMRLEDLEDANSATLPRWRVAFENVSQTESALLENYWGPDTPWRLESWEIDVEQPDETPFTAGETFVVMQVTTDFKDALLDMQSEGFSLGGTVPGRRFTATGGFPFIARRQ
jgi:hypothetical protein